MSLTKRSMPDHDDSCYQPDPRECFGPRRGIAVPVCLMATEEFDAFEKASLEEFRLQQAENVLAEWDDLDREEYSQWADRYESTLDRDAA